MAEKAANAMQRRLRQAAAAAGLIAFAIAALLSGTDRQSRDFPNAPSIVGWPYDTGAARARAILAFVQSGPKSAIGLAKRAILSDPISAQPISLLGRSQLYAGETQEARKTFEVAGQMGWRDGMTQIYWLDQALQAGDLKVAAERLDALLRQSPHDENRDRFIAVVAATPEGRDAIAQRLKLAPPWAHTIVSVVADLPAEQLAQRVDVVLRTGRGVWSCADAATITQKLIDSNMLIEAQAVWRGNCASSNSLVFDGGFDQLDTTVATRGFDWLLSGRGDVDVVPAMDTAGNRLLDIEVTAPRTLPVLSQLVVVQQGNYRLRWRTPDTPANMARGLTVSLSCRYNLADAEPGVADSTAKNRYVKVFQVDASCPARRIIFWLAPRSPIHLDDVVLERL